jgi:Uma2 family endonuclease
MSVIPPPARPATLDDLLRTEGKAELIRGRIVEIMPSGRKPSRKAFRIAKSLDDFVESAGVGEAYADNMGFAVAHLQLTSGRQSFSPDAAYYSGPFPADDMRFITGPPTFAVEVRSEDDYTGPAAEQALADKRADYFEAGTRVVWDVDPVNGWIDCYRAAAPTAPQRFAAGDTADAEPAVPGWRLSVDWLMRP